MELTVSEMRRKVLPHGLPPFHPFHPGFVVLGLTEHLQSAQEEEEY